jgi:hypothetical protein
LADGRPKDNWDASERSTPTKPAVVNREEAPSYGVIGLPSASNDSTLPNLARMS